MEKLAEQIAGQILKKCKNKPEIAIILGSGLRDFVLALKNRTEIKFTELEGMPLTNVVGHKNSFSAGMLGDKSVLVMEGRFHLYDGFSPKQVALPIYIFKKMGIEKLIITNASGGVNEKYNAGDIMIITDHINFTGQNPLVNGAIIEGKEKFVDLSNCYTKDWVDKIKQVSNKLNLTLQYGTYMQFLGPTYETPAEVKMARLMGADAVGMSTVMEAIAGCQCEMKILGLSSISNKAVGTTTNKISHLDVLKVSEQSKDKLIMLISEFVKMI